MNPTKGEDDSLVKLALDIFDEGIGEYVNAEIEAIARMVEHAEELVERYPLDGHVDVSGTLANIAEAIRERKQ